jgi:hypothetical protein
LKDETIVQNVVALSSSSLSSNFTKKERQTMFGFKGLKKWCERSQNQSYPTAQAVIQPIA